jgi:hypothetical protein
MSTVLQHHHPRPHRTQLLAAGAALLAVVTVGALFEAMHDDAPTATNGPDLPVTLPHHHLHGSSSMEGQWNHAGTRSGGHTVPGQ